MIVDLAYFRLLLMLKIEPTKLQERLAKNAIKEASSMDENGQNTYFKVGERKSEV